MILDGFAASSIASAVQVIRSGGLVGLPTETVYGLGADAENASAVAAIFRTKGRPADHPLIVHVANAASAAHFAAALPDFAQRLMEAFWPGPLTLILPRRAAVATPAAGGQNSIGLRCPAHPVAQALLKALNNWGQIPINAKELESDPNLVWGIAAPSANLFGRVSPTTAQHVQSEFGSELLILDGGPCTVGIESTIIDCTRGAPVLLRPGAVTRAQVQGVCGRVVSEEELAALGMAAPRASGTLESHYAPHASVRLMDAKALQTALDLLGADVDGAPDSPVIATYARAVLKTRSAKVLRRSMPADAQAAAQQLFAALREFDALGVKLIWVEMPPETPDWDAVRDRLLRASADLD